MLDKRKMNLNVSFLKNPYLPQRRYKYIFSLRLCLTMLIFLIKRSRKWKSNQSWCINLIISTELRHPNSHWIVENLIHFYMTRGFCYCCSIESWESRKPWKIHQPDTIKMKVIHRWEMREMITVMNPWSTDCNH